MASKVKIFINVFFVIVAILFSASAFANSVHGILMVVKGDVKIIQKDKTTPAKIGAKIFPGDTIITKKDSRAKLVMIDKNIINISPDSKFLLEKYEFNPDTDKKGALLNVIYGKVRTTVNQKYDGTQNKFQVKTKSSVAGVRGTDFLVAFNKTTDTSKVVTFEGKVEVGTGLDSSGKIMNSVFVTPGQFTVANMGTPPSVPMNMPESEINSLNEQSVAEVPMKDKEKSDKDPNGENKERAPSNNEPGEKSPGDQTGKKKSPQGDDPTGGVMDEMGEDVSAPVVADNNQMLPPSLIPMDGIAPIGMEPLMPPIDPTLIQGKANVIINLVPSP